MNNNEKALIILNDLIEKVTDFEVVVAGFSLEQGIAPNEDGFKVLDGNQTFTITYFSD